MNARAREVLKLFLFSLIFITILAGYYLYKAVQQYRTAISPFVGDSYIQNDPVIGFVQRSNISAWSTVPPHFTIHSDDRGLRADRPDLKAPSKVDLLGIGCSNTWGHGVNDNETFVKVLAKEKNLKTANAAMASYGATAAYLSMLRFSDLQPSVIIYGLADNQVSVSMKPCAPSLSPYCRPTAFVDFDKEGRPFIHPPAYRSEKYFQFMKDISMKHPFGWRDIYWTIQSDILMLTGKHWLKINARYRAAEDPEFRRKTMHYLVDRMQEASSRMGARLIILYIPDVYPPHPIPAELKEAIGPYEQKGSLVFLDTTPFLSAYAEKYGWKALNESDHPTAVAHRIIAKALGPVIDDAYRKR